MKAQRLPGATVVLILVAALVASCVGPTAIETPTDAPPPTKPPPTREPTEEPEVVATFIFGRGGDSVQLDPAVVTDSESRCTSTSRARPGRSRRWPPGVLPMRTAASGRAGCARPSSTMGPISTPTPSSLTLSAGALPITPTALRASGSSATNPCGVASTTAASSRPPKE